MFTHASWAASREDAYGRLAFLGDAVLELAVSAHLYPRLDAARYGEGRLSQIRAHIVCAASCEAVARRLGVEDELRASVPDGNGPVEAVFTERVLSSITEAIIGACFIEHGYERVAPAVIEAFGPEIADALTHPIDHKSALQELLAQRHRTVEYVLIGREGPDHSPRFRAAAQVGGEVLAHGTGPSKKAAQQDAARSALENLTADKSVPPA